MVLGEGDKGNSVIKFFAFVFCKNNVSLCDRDTIFLIKIKFNFEEYYNFDSYNDKLCR